MKKEKIKNIAIRSSAGFLAFAAGLAATFFLVPNKVRTIVFDDPVAEQVPETHFSRFVSRVMDIIDEENDEKSEGIVGRINNLTVEWPENKIVVDGSLGFAMRNINDLDLTVDLGVNYNDKTLDLAVGYTGRTFYLNFQDLFIKSSYVNTQDLLEKMNYLFFNSSVPEDEGLGISVDIDGILDNLISGFDINSLMSGGGDGGLGIEFGEEVEVETNKIKAPLTISLGEDQEPIEISMYFTKDTNILQNVELTKIQFGDVKISGGISFEVFKDQPVYGFDNENYVGYHDFKNKNFIEVINYKSWFDDIFNLLNKKTLGIDLKFSADQDDGTGAVNIGQIFGSIDVDVSKFILPIPKVINADTFAKEDIIVDKSIKRNDNGEETVVEEILDNLVAGIDLSVNRDEEHYADLNLTYADQNAFLSLNDGVIKTKMDIETLNYVIDKVSSLIEDDSAENTRRVLRGETKENDLFDFVTSSELVTAIKDGKYDGILDVLESISNSESGINIKLNLSSLGLGENARVELNLDANENGEKGVTSLKCDDIEMKEGIFDLELSTRDYKQANIDKVLNVKDSYENFDFAVGVFDQVSSILDSKKTGFELEGSLLGEDKLGMSFAGEGQLDYGEKYGFGNINIYNHNNPENVAEKSETHPVKLYIDNTTEDKEVNNLKLVYGKNEKLKGKLSIKSIDDIIGVVKKLIDKNDRRFAKFLDPIMKMIYESVIGQIISSKDYMRLSKAEFIKSISQNVDGTYLEIKLSKDLFAGFITEDLNVHLNFEVLDGVKQLSSLEIIDLKLNDTLGNKTVNCKITLRDFDENKALPLNLNDTYMNFSSLGTLIQFGIDSTELNVYHLTANVTAKFPIKILDLAFTLADLSLDFYIEVIGEDTKVYGKIPDIPYIIVASNDMYTDVDTEFIFEPSKHYDASSDDSIGGYFHILRHEGHHGIFNRNFEQYYYRATSEAFVDDIISYLLVDALDFKTSIIEKIGNINLDSSSSDQSIEEMFIDNGFNYSVDNSGTSKWDLKMNLDKLTGISALTSLDAQLYGAKQVNSEGEEKSYLNKLHAALPIVASVITIDLDATIYLKDINPNAGSWKDQFPEVNDRFEKICNIYNGMTAAQKSSYNSNYLNNPNKEYEVKLDKSRPSIF